MNKIDIKLPSNFNFGIFFGFIFLIFSLYFYYKTSLLFYFCLPLSLAFFLLAFFNPEFLSPFNLGWMKFGIFLGSIVNPIILCFIFFLIFTPIGLLMRVCGRDQLSLKNIKRKSYWKKRDKNNDKFSTFKNQF
jgi:hypothetical protein